MKIIKNYSNVWNSERMIYALNDLVLPRPVSMTQIFWILFFFLLSLFLKGIPPFIFQDSILMNHVAIPMFLAWFVSRKRLDGKRPYNYLKSYILYLVTPRTYTRGKPVVFNDRAYRNTVITIGKKRERKRRRRKARIEK